MTAPSKYTATPNASAISYADMPLAYRMQTSLVLGDLVIAAAKWVRSHLSSRDTRCCAHIAPEEPSESCGLC